MLRLKNVEFQLSFYFKGAKMLTNYKQKCENFIKKWVATNTRHRLDNLVLDDYKERTADFSMEVVNKFSVECSKNTRKGSVRSNEIYYKKSQYLSAIQKEIQIEFDNEANFESLVSEISKGEYGKYDILGFIGIGNTFYYEYSCNKCKGNGEVKCDKCRNGEVKCDKSGCVNGRIRKTKRENGRDRTYYEECSKCRGSGRITCIKCKGSAWIKCENCNATGVLTEVGEIKMLTYPQYKAIYPDNIDNEIKEVIEKHCDGGSKYPQLGKITKIERESLKQSTSKKYVWEKYNATIPYAKFSISYNDEKFAWFIYGTNLQIYENSGMLNAILSSDIVALVKIAKQSFFANTAILKHSKDIVANFMESKINQQIIEFDTDDKDNREQDIDKRAEIVANNIRGDSISKDYIKRTIQSFEKMTKNFCKGITCINISFALIVSFIISGVYKYGFLSPLIVFPIFIYCSTKYKKFALKKCWGKILFEWIEKREIIKSRYFSYTFIGEVVVFAITYFVNIQNNINILDF